MNTQKSIGVVRKISPEGRLVIPIEYRSLFDMNGGDSLSFLIGDESFILAKQGSHLPDSGEFVDISYTRPIYKSGCVIIPSFLRNRYKINDNSKVSMLAVNGFIEVHTFESECVFCGSTSSLTEFSGQHICKRCLLALKGGKTNGMDNA